MIPLAVLLALSASAAEYDFSDPSFWLKHYEIPNAYCSKGIAVEVKDFDSVAPIFKACGSHHPDDEKQWHADCKVPVSAASDIVGRLKGAGRLLSYSQECQEPDLLPEIDYKLLNLRREADELKLSSAAHSGISGLLEAQFAHLGWLIHRRTLAEMTSVSLTAALSPAPPGFQGHQDWRMAHRHTTHVVNYPWRPWSRTPRSVCEQMEYIDAGFAIPVEGDAMAKFADIVDKIGADIPTSTCVEIPRGRPWRLVLSKEPRAKVLRRMLEFPNLVSWRLMTPSRPGESILDDRKHAILSREIAEARSALERTPHIKSLLQSETARLAPNARSLDELKDGTIIHFRTNGR